MNAYLRQLGAIVWKDVLLEIRSRDRIAAMGAFAVLAATLFNFSIDTTAVRPQDVAAGLIWMTMIFGGLIGVGRTLHLEAQDGAFRGVLPSPTPKDAVFLAKVIANFVLLYTVSLLILGVFAPIEVSPVQIHREPRAYEIGYDSIGWERAEENSFAA